MWNLQSGQKRKAFTLPEGSAHATGLASDALNKQLIAATADGFLHVRSLMILTLCEKTHTAFCYRQFYDFHDPALKASVGVPGRARITSVLLNRDNNLLAFASEDHIVRIMDIETRRIVRELTACKSDIVDLVRTETQPLAGLSP